MSMALELTGASFDGAVNTGVVLVDFWAEWCQPCRMMGPILDDLTGTFEGKAAITKVNVDNESELAAKFEVQSIPTIIIFKDGQIQKRFLGVTSKADLTAALNAAIG